MYRTKSRTKKSNKYVGRVGQKLEPNVGRKVGQNNRTKISNQKSDKKFKKKLDKYIGKSSDKKSDKLMYSYFEKVHATIPKGIVSGFEFTVVQRNLKEWHERPSDACLRVLKESHKSRCEGYCVRNSVLMISHVTFRDCRVHIFSDNLSRNSCIQNVGQKVGQNNATQHKHAL